jgi:hypothetical protein
MRWLTTASHDDVVAAALLALPAEDPEIVDLSIRHYRQIGFWAADPAPVRADIARWESDLVAGGLLPPSSELTGIIWQEGESR